MGTTKESRSGNPAKKAAAKKRASSASDFKKRARGVDLPLPSGLSVVAKRVDLQTFLKQGSIPNPLMEVISEALDKGQSAEVEKMVAEPDKVDLEMVQEMYQTVNSVVVASVVEPRVHEVPKDDEDRDDDSLYVDEVDDTDKMFIFQWAVGGTSDLEQFRREASADLDALAQIQGRGNAAKSADRARAR